MIIKNGLVFSENAKFNEKELWISGDKIVNQEETANIIGDELIDATGCYVIPGLIDIHFHGCVGYDFCDGTKEAIEKMAEYQLANGITTICPASMTFSEEQLTAIFENAASYNGEQGASLVGINMEGPFISLEKKAFHLYICI